MIKFCAFVVAGVLVFPFTYTAGWVVAMLFSSVGVTLSDSLGVIVIAVLAFAAVGVSSSVYRRLVRHMTRTT